MALFGHRTSLSDLLRIIPDEELIKISHQTHVDRYSKVLTGKLMFYMLFYGLLTQDRLGQRGLADTYSSPQFQSIFRFSGEKKKISHSSLSERLSVIDISFFEQSYELLRKQFSSFYPGEQLYGLNLQRVASSLVVEMSNKLREGIQCGNEYGKKKMLKYTLNFDGMYGTFCRVHAKEMYTCESVSLPENVFSHFQKHKDHATVYLFDRGQSSAEAFQQMKQQDGLLFVGRLLKNRKLHVLGQLNTNNKSFNQGYLKQDLLVKLYIQKKYINEKGKESKRVVLSEETFRVIRFKPAGKDEDIVLITNMLNMRAESIAKLYRRRWDIEVFFRFLKQEVNFKDFLSLHPNGIQVVLYMILIVAMVVMIYKKTKNIGYKTAVRRIKMEMEGICMAIGVKLSGGDINKLNFLEEP
jgi:hypothetical protein